MTHAARIIEFLAQFPGRDDDEISRALGISPRQTVNTVCSQLAARGLLKRLKGERGKLVNYVTGKMPTSPVGYGRAVMRKVDFGSKRDRILNSMEVANQKFIDRSPFEGPSLYFHRTSLEAAQSGNLERFTEQVYALLPSWGMHRMGGGPRMVDFPIFCQSLQRVRQYVEPLRNASPQNLGEAGWSQLESAFRGIQCMKTSVHLIGNSKVLAHWLPNLVPPIDREYTLKFVGYSGNLSGYDQGWRLLRTLLDELFYPVAEAPQFQTFAAKWALRPDENPWHSSALKIIDNLIIGLVGRRAKPT